MVINILLLLIVLSLESTIGLPVFFLYLAYGLISRRSDKFILLALIITAFFLAIFYSFSWPLLAFFLLIFHLASQKFASNLFLELFLFICLNLLIFKIGQLQLNYFYLVHLPAFLFYFYKSNFKKYAS